MFDGKKYITRGIFENIPIEIQLILDDGDYSTMLLADEY